MNGHHIPSTIVAYICDGCGRKELSSIVIKPSHYSGGKKCPGTVFRCHYLLNGTDDLDQPSFQSRTAITTDEDGNEWVVQDPEGLA